MLLIAFRNLFQEFNRLIVSIGGVAFSIILIVTLFGILNGAVEQNVRPIKENPTDIFILRKGMSDMYHGVPLVSLSDIELLKQESGVADVVPIISQRPAAKGSDKTYHLFLFSYDPNKPQGAPWELTAGTKNITDDEIIIPTTLAKKLGKSVGDSFEFSESDKVWRIAGLVPGASSFGNHHSWITSHAAQESVKVPGTASFAYLTLDNPAQAESKAVELQDKYPNLHILSKQQFIEETNKELSETFLPILQATVAIAVLIGTAVIGLTIYTATIDKSREIGILKAIGINQWQLYTIVLVQSLVTTAIGVGVGIILSFGVGYLLDKLLDLAFVVTNPTYGIVIGLSFGMSLIASLLPVRRLIAIDPAEVFKS